MAMTDDGALMRLLTKIHDDKGLDFTQYKEKSIIRRIHSRLLRNDIESYDEYITILNRDPREYSELLNALAINVTEFFRNPESFHAIEKTVIPRVIYSKRAHKHKIIRAWSCGCSSGDEPYSLAMLFLEKLGKAKKDFLLAIIGSDIDAGAIDEARQLVYSRARLKAIDKRLINKYFDQAGEDTFKLKNTVRSLVRFRRHDIIKSAPFMHCDIILCRNLLIYFNKELQEEVLLKFYDCLNPGGYLVLGMTESLPGAALNAFEFVDNARRVYKRPENMSLSYAKNEMLSQEAIDKIVNGMLGKE